MVTSSEIRTDRQTTDVQETAISAEGDIEFELSFSTFDEIFEGTLLNNFSSPLNISGSDISVDGTNNNIDSASTDFSSVNDGQWINVGGFSDSANNGYFRVDSGSTNTLSVQYANLNDESSGNTITIDGEELRNGTTDKFYTFEKEFGDVGDFYTYPGTYISSLSLSFEAESLLTGSISIMAEQEKHNESQTPGSITSSNTNPITNATSNVKDFRLGGSTSPVALSIDFTYDNNLRERPAIGQKATQEFGTGTIDLTGSLELYFNDDSQYQTYLDNNRTDMNFRVEDDDGNSYIFDFMEMKFEDGSVEISSQNEDIFTSVDFTAFRDDSADPTDDTFAIHRFPA